jgi:hypothetical protein
VKHKSVHHYHQTKNQWWHQMSNQVNIWQICNRNQTTVDCTKDDSAACKWKSWLQCNDQFCFKEQLMRLDRPTWPHVRTESYWVINRGIEVDSKYAIGLLIKTTMSTTYKTLRLLPLMHQTCTGSWFSKNRCGVPFWQYSLTQKDVATEEAVQSLCNNFGICVKQNMICI